MLPSLGFQEIVLLAVLALVVIGPKDLPLMARKLGRWMGKMRGMAAEFRAGFDELARQAELDELKKEVEALRNNSTFTDIRREINRPIPLDPIPALPAPEPDIKAHTEPPPEGAANDEEKTEPTPPVAVSGGGA